MALRAAPFAPLPIHHQQQGGTDKPRCWVDLSTVADSKISNPPWVNIESAGWVNIQAAPTRDQRSTAITAAADIDDADVPF
jgi:hypothetical protein